MFHENDWKKKQFIETRNNLRESAICFDHTKICRRRGKQPQQGTWEFVDRYAVPTHTQAHSKCCVSNENIFEWIRGSATRYRYRCARVEVEISLNLCCFFLVELASVPFNVYTILSDSARLFARFMLRNLHSTHLSRFVVVVFVLIFHLIIFFSSHSWKPFKQLISNHKKLWIWSDLITKLFIRFVCCL